MEDDSNNPFDTRGIAEILGNIPSKKRKKPINNLKLAMAVDGTDLVIAPNAKDLSAAEKRIRLQNKQRGVEFLDEALSIMIDLARNSTNEAVRRDAARDILDRYGGKATTLNSDGNPTNHILPIFNIIGANNYQVTPVLEGSFDLPEEEDDSGTS